MTILSTRRRQAELDDVVPDLRTADQRRGASTYLTGRDRDRVPTFADVKPIEDEPVVLPRPKRDIDAPGYRPPATRAALAGLREDSRFQRHQTARIPVGAYRNAVVFGDALERTVPERLAACGLVYAKRGTAVAR